MKNWILVLYILLVGGFLFTACTNRDLKVCHIGVSQCSDDEWRHKMNTEMLREALFYDGLEVEIRSAKDNNQAQIADIQYFIDKEEAAKKAQKEAMVKAQMDKFKNHLQGF